MLTVRQECSPLIEINGSSKIKAVTFTANGEYIVGGGDGLRVWRLDGKQMATMAARDVNCLAVAKDGRWIAAGTRFGYVFVWDAKTFERVFSHWEDLSDVTGVDFSLDSARRSIEEPDSYRLGRCSSQKCTHTPPQESGDSSEILAARSSNRDSHF